MRDNRESRLAAASRFAGRCLLYAGLIGSAGLLGAHAQNAAQQKALAQLLGAQSSSTSIPSGVEATSVPLDMPGGLAFDSAGNLYVADTDHNVVREVSLAGIITTVAGTGDQGFAGDGGAATSAQLDSPVGVAVDSHNNIYIADTHNQRIREVSGGVINTIAGNGVAGFAGDGGPAASAEFDLPTALAMDSNGNLYIADTNNFRIRKISGGAITTVAGNGEQTFSGDGGLATAAGLDSPNGVAVDASFNLYIGDTHNQRVRLVTASTGIITTIAGNGVKTFNGDGTAVSAALARPRGVAIDSAGNIYIADSDNNRIRMISGGQLTTVAGNGQEGFTGDTNASTSASLDTPRAVAANGSTHVFSDTLNNRVRVISNNTVNTIAGLAPATSEQIVLSGATSGVYGTGTLTATFSNGGATGTGTVTFLDELGSTAATVGTASLSSNTAALDTSHLSAGTHLLVASYAGDAHNSPVVSGVFVYQVTQAPLVAVANAINMLYGQPTPTPSGTLTGVLPQDNGNVTAVFTTTATLTSAPGTYPISVALSGSAAANYTVSLGAGSGSVIIAKAPTHTTLGLSTSAPVFGAPLTITATVASTTSGTPTGSVIFYNGATQLNNTPVVLTNGVASLSISSLPVGSATLSVVYSGDTNFLGSTSSNLVSTIISPDFSIAATPASQTVLPQHSAAYSLTLTPVNSTMVYPVTLTAAGLPAGVTASFTPSSVAAGAGATTVTMTLSASATATNHPLPLPWTPAGGSAAFALLLLPLAFTRRMRQTAGRLGRAARLLILTIALGTLFGALSGCGGGGFFGHGTGSYTVTVTANNGPDTHTTNVTLVVK